MPPPRVLPLKLQVNHLQKIFTKLNPEVDLQEIDWDITGKGILDPQATYNENYQNMEAAYPQYKWFETSQDRVNTKEEAIDEYGQYLDYILGLAVIPEAQEDVRAVLDKALDDYRYRTERDMEKTTLKKTVKRLEEQLLEAKRTGSPQIEVIGEEARKITVETSRPKVRMTKELERKLRDIFVASFTRVGKSPSRFMSEYRLELPFIKSLTREEDMVNAVEELAKDIIRREIKPPKIKRIPEPTAEAPPPEGDRIHILRPTDEEEEEEEGPPGYVPPTTPAFPMVALSPAPFPRNLSGEERDDIWRAFMDELTMRGISAFTFRKEFGDWLGTFTFKSWEEVREHFESLLEQIQTGKPMLFPLHKVMVPWETTEEAVVHFSSIGIYDSMDAMITDLYSFGFDTTDEEVKKIILDQYKKKNLKLMISSKEYLEALIDQKLE